MQAEILVTKIGCGVVEDETSHNKTDWAKVYGLEATFTKSDMFSGFNEIHYSIVDPVTLKPSIHLAQQIKQRFEALNPKTPIKMKFELAMSTSAKRQVLSICGLAV